jgi:hypothetical protein
LGSTRPANRRRRRSRASLAAPKRRQPTERLFSYKKLLQAGSAAAAIAAILGVIFTVSDRARGLFGSEARPGIHLEQLGLEGMPLKTYLRTKEGVTSFRGLGYTPTELASKVLAVDFDARFEGSSKGASYPIRLTLQGRDSKGQVENVDQEQDDYALDAGVDSCGCHSFFFLRARDAAYRVIAQVLRPDEPTSEPLAEKESTWYQR